MPASDFIDSGTLTLAPSYNTQRVYRNFWRVSDRADSAYQDQFDARGAKIVPPHARESESGYQDRLNKCIARPYVRPIVNRYNDHATRGAVERPSDGGDTYTAFVADVDGMGTSMHDFMARAGRMAQIEGVAGLLMDDTRHGESQADQQGRVVVHVIHADQVLNWVEWQGEVVEAVILLEQPDGTHFLWYVGPEYVQRIDIKQPTQRQKNKVQLRGVSNPLSLHRIEVTTIGEPMRHNWGGTPYKRLWPFRTDSECAGDTAQAGPIAESQKRLVNFESYLREEIEKCTFSWYVLSGVDADQVDDATVGNSKFMCLPDATSSATRLGADSSQAASIRETITQEVRELYRVAGLSPGDPLQAGAPESGVAKAFAFNEIEATLSKLADTLQAGENWIVKRWAQGTGNTYPGDAKWPDKFDSPNLAAELERTIRTVASPLPTLIKAAELRRYAGVAYQFDADQKARLESEIEAQFSTQRPDTTEEIIGI